MPNIDCLYLLMLINPVTFVVTYEHYNHFNDVDDRAKYLSAANYKVCIFKAL